MKLKFFFFILSLLLLAVWGVLLVLSFKERGMLFYMVEGIITFSLIFLIFFYRKVIKPLDTIGNGMDLLREQDFSSRLTVFLYDMHDFILLERSWDFSACL